MRTAPGRAPAAPELVRRQCPAAALREQDGVHLAFTIPRQGLDLPALFEAIEGGPSPAGWRGAWTVGLVQGWHMLVLLSVAQHYAKATAFRRGWHYAICAGGKEAAGIEEYSLSQTTLEQVFIHMARDASHAEDGGISSDGAQHA